MLRVSHLWEQLYFNGGRSFPIPTTRGGLVCTNFDKRTQPLTCRLPIGRPPPFYTNQVLSVTAPTAGTEAKAPIKLYTCGRASNICTFIIEGKVDIEAGAEGQL